MATVLSLGMAAMVFQAIRLTRLHLQRAEEAERTLSSAEGRDMIVELDPLLGMAVPVSDAGGVMRASWHPVRFPAGWESRCGGFPNEKAYKDLNLGGRRAWCESKCSGRWRVEAPSSQNPVFWFENHQDAMDFSLAWFPFKCN